MEIFQYALIAQVESVRFGREMYSLKIFFGLVRKAPIPTNLIG